jgi:hypothetical protein
MPICGIIQRGFILCIHRHPMQQLLTIIGLNVSIEQIDGECDSHAARVIRRNSHRPMERIGGFMRSP